LCTTQSAWSERFPIFQSHIDLAQSYWSKLVKSGDIVIDATCGNGHDTLLLARLALTADSGYLYGFDIQKEAIDSTRENLQSQLSLPLLERVFLHQRSHSNLVDALPSGCRPKLIVYNLGYLPGGDKAMTTMLDTTLQSIQQAQALIANGGAISITCYPGHLEGLQEESALMEIVCQLPAATWSCCHHRWLNRKNAPSLLLIQKSLKAE